jgi:hypothetical protein
MASFRPEAAIAEFSMCESPRPSGRRLRPVFPGKYLESVAFFRDDDSSKLRKTRRKTFHREWRRQLRKAGAPIGDKVGRLSKERGGGAKGECPTFRKSASVGKFYR